MLSNILKKAGLDASVALVHRSKEPDPEGIKLPMLSFGNHIIVQVFNKGKRYWLDPTNTYFGIGVIPDDLMSKMSLVLEGEGKGFSRISYDQKNISTYSEVSTFQKIENGFTVQDDTTRTGIYSEIMATDPLFNKPKELEKSFKDFLRGSGKKLISANFEFGERKVLDTKKDSLVYESETGPFEYFLKDRAVVAIPDDHFKLFDQLKRYPFLTGNIGTIGTTSKKEIIRGYQFESKSSFTCRAQSKWANYEIIVKNKPNRVELKFKEEIQAQYINLSSEDEKKEFLQFYKQYKKCFFKRAFLLQEL